MLRRSRHRYGIGTCGAAVGEADGVAALRQRLLAFSIGVEVLLLAIDGGGHTWPGGDACLSARAFGRVTHDWNSALIWEFFAALR